MKPEEDSNECKKNETRHRRHLVVVVGVCLRLEYMHANCGTGQKGWATDHSRERSLRPLCGRLVGLALSLACKDKGQALLENTHQIANCLLRRPKLWIFSQGPGEALNWELGHWPRTSAASSSSEYTSKDRKLPIEQTALSLRSWGSWARPGPCPALGSSHWPLAGSQRQPRPAWALWALFSLLPTSLIACFDRL